MKKPITIPCMGYNIFADSLELLQSNTKTVINTINQYSYCMAEKDPAFKKALLASDIVLPDGVGITFAAKFLHGKKIKKIAGADLHLHLLKKLEKNNGSCFYLGSSEKTLSKIKEKMALEYPNIKVGSYSPPFKSQFTIEDNTNMINAINKFSPDVLFIGMTAPKQEKWSYEHKNKLNANKICAIGAVFDFYAGTVKRPNKFWQNLGLEWLGRFIKEPKRMWTRYVTNGVLYLNFLIKEKIKG